METTHLSLIICGMPSEDVSTGCSTHVKFASHVAEHVSFNHVKDLYDTWRSEHIVPYWTLIQDEACLDDFVKCTGNDIIMSSYSVTPSFGGERYYMFFTMYDSVSTYFLIPVCAFAHRVDIGAYMTESTAVQSIVCYFQTPLIDMSPKIHLDGNLVLEVEICELTHKVIVSDMIVDKNGKICITEESHYERMSRLMDLFDDVFHPHEREYEVYLPIPRPFKDTIQTLHEWPWQDLTCGALLYRCLFSRDIIATQRNVCIPLNEQQLEQTYMMNIFKGGLPDLYYVYMREYEAGLLCMRTLEESRLVQQYIKDAICQKKRQDILIPCRWCKQNGSYTVIFSD